MEKLRGNLFSAIKIVSGMNATFTRDRCLSGSLEVWSLRRDARPRQSRCQRGERDAVTTGEQGLMPLRTSHVHISRVVVTRYCRRLRRMSKKLIGICSIVN